VHTVTYDENGTRIDTESEYTRLIPARTDYHHVTVAAPHKDVLVQPVHVAHPTRYTNAYDFPIAAGREGTYDIGVTSGGHTATGTLRVVAPYETGYRLQLVPVPAVLGAAAQPLYVASITDGKGRILDVRDEFGRDRTVSVAFGDGRVENVWSEHPPRHQTRPSYTARSLGRPAWSPRWRAAPGPRAPHTAPSRRAASRSR